MLLEVEGKAPVPGVNARQVKVAIEKLRSYGPSSYASLTNERGSYLQVAGGGLTCMLERRDADAGRHYRAHLDSPSPIFPDDTILAFSGGEIRLKADEWLTAGLVEEAFLAFLENRPLPSLIGWRDISYIFGINK